MQCAKRMHNTEKKSTRRHVKGENTILHIKKNLVRQSKIVVSTIDMPLLEIETRLKEK